MPPHHHTGLPSSSHHIASTGTYTPLDACAMPYPSTSSISLYKTDPRIDSNQPVLICHGCPHVLSDPPGLHHHPQVRLTPSHPLETALLAHSQVWPMCYPGSHPAQADRSSDGSVSTIPGEEVWTVGQVRPDVGTGTTSSVADGSGATSTTVSVPDVGQGSLTSDSAQPTIPSLGDSRETSSSVSTVTSDLPPTQVPSVGSLRVSCPCLCLRW